MAQLSCSFLGGFSVRLDNRAITHFPYDKVRALLAFLVIEDAHPHRREQLCTLFWPDSTTTKARQSLSQALHSLRRVLDGELPMHADRQEVRLDRSGDFWCDVLEFQRLALSAETAQLTDDEPTIDMLTDWEEAIALYRGPLLDGFSLPDAEPFDEWVLLQREWLQRMAVETLCRLVTGRQRLSDSERALHFAWRLLELEPWDEAHHRQVIKLLLDLGRHAEALAQYKRCEAILQRELGVEPQPETVALYTTLRARSNHTASVAVSPNSQDSPPLSLPVQGTPFIGREDELAQIIRRLSDPACRLLTIVGPGGVGKTRLAIEAAGICGIPFAHGIHFVDLAPVRDLESLPATILQAIDAPRSGGASAGAQLLRALADQQMLLILDNWEHLADGYGLLIQILQAAPRLKLLVTSRERLNLREEWLLPLLGLALPPTPTPNPAYTVGDGASSIQDLSPPDLSKYDATQLFLRSTRRLDPDYTPLPEEIPQIVQICRTLDGIPLAIELAAAWTRSLSCAEIARKLTDSLGILTLSWRDVPPRQRSMRATFDHSWQLLSGGQQDLLRRLSVFRGGFSAQSAEAVTGATLSALAELVDRSWLWHTPSGRYRMHELARQYCEEQMRLQDPKTQWCIHDQHSAHYASFIHAQEQGYNRQRQAMATILPDIGNVMAAWHWAVENHDVARIQQISISLFFYAEMEGWYYTIIEMFDIALDALRSQWQTCADQVDCRQILAPVITGLLYVQASLYLHLGRLEQADTCIRKGTDILSAVPENDSILERQMWLKMVSARLFGARGDYEAAGALYAELLTFAKTVDIPYWPYVPEIGSRFLQSEFYMLSARSSWQLGDYSLAESQVRQALALREQIGEKRFRAYNLGMLASILLTTGDHAQAKLAAMQGLRLSQDFGDVISTATAHLVLGRVYVHQGDYKQARLRCRRALSVGQQTGHHYLLMESTIELGRIALAEADPTTARALFEDAIATVEVLGTAHSNQLVAATLGLAWSALALNEITKAGDYFTKAQRMPGGAAFERMEATLGMAQVLHRQGCLDQARHLFKVVLEDQTTSHITRLAAGEAATTSL